MTTETRTVRQRLRDANSYSQPLCSVAANIMDHLEADNVRLKKALERIDEHCSAAEPVRSDYETDQEYWEAFGVWRMALIARAALHPQQEQK